MQPTSKRLDRLLGWLWASLSALRSMVKGRSFGITQDPPCITRINRLLWSKLTYHDSESLSQQTEPSRGWLYLPNILNSPEFQRGRRKRFKMKKMVLFVSLRHPPSWTSAEKKMLCLSLRTFWTQRLWNFSRDSDEQSGLLFFVCVRSRRGRKRKPAVM